MSFPSSPVKLFDWGVLDPLVYLPPVLDDINDACPRIDLRTPRLIPVPFPASPDNRPGGMRVATRDAS